MDKSKPEKDASILEEVTPIKTKKKNKLNDGDDFTMSSHDDFTPIAEEKINTRTDDSKFDQEARYRFKQTSIMKSEDVPISHSEARAQFLFSKKGNTVVSICEESHYSFPFKTGGLEDFLSLSDEIRREIHFKINNEGVPVDVLNKNDLKKRWEIFKQGKLLENELIKTMQRTSPENFTKIVEAGDKEFNDVNYFIQVLMTNLYFKEIFNQYLTKPFEELVTERFTSLSNFFQNVVIEADLIYSKVKEDNKFITIRKVSKLDRSKLDEFELIKQYNKMYKPKIKFSFSEYSYDYRVTKVINKQDGLIQHASISLLEAIKNNLSSSVNFELKRIEK